jgi:hypothetical protein
MDSKLFFSRKWQAAGYEKKYEHPRTWLFVVVGGTGVRGGGDRSAELLGQAAHEAGKVKGVGAAGPVVRIAIVAVMRTRTVPATATSATAGAGTTATVAATSPAPTASAGKWLVFGELVVGLVGGDFSRVGNVYRIWRALFFETALLCGGRGIMSLVLVGSVLWFCFFATASVPVPRAGLVGARWLEPLLPLVPWPRGTTVAEWEAVAEEIGVRAGTVACASGAGAGAGGLVGVKGVDKVPEEGIGVGMSWS